MVTRHKRFSIDRLEDRIAPCGAFGGLVASVAHGEAAEIGIEIPDGPASDNGSDVGNLKSAIGTDGDPDTQGVSERIHASQDFACGD
jgi:hypothetical protein